MNVHSAGSDVLKVGLIGCGSRGTGAAVDAMDADRGAKLVAMADLFGEKVTARRELLRRMKGDRVDVPDGRCFAGFDAYRRLLAADVDVVLIATPSHYHPIFTRAAIEAGKHVFCEKPHAVDAFGVRDMLAAGETAREKGLSIVSGLYWRYCPVTTEAFRRVADGAIGKILSVECNYWSAGKATALRRPDWSEMRHQHANWHHFRWLSGDLPALMLVHNLDRLNWIMKETPPVAAWGLGGRHAGAAGSLGSDMFDHHAVVFEYADGARAHGYASQVVGARGAGVDIITGTKGRCLWRAHRCQIEGQHAWSSPRGASVNKYKIEHQTLFSSIRNAGGVNDAKIAARSALMALLTCMATYTGRRVLWEEAMNSQERLAPDRYTWDATPPVVPDAGGNYPAPIPGITKLS